MISGSERFDSSQQCQGPGSADRFGGSLMRRVTTTLDDDLMDIDRLIAARCY
jgi:hypothetical protein